MNSEMRSICCQTENERSIANFLGRRVKVFISRHLFLLSGHCGSQLLALTALKTQLKGRWERMLDLFGRRSPCTWFDRVSLMQAAAGGPLARTFLALSCPRRLHAHINGQITWAVQHIHAAREFTLAVVRTTTGALFSFNSSTCIGAARGGKRRATSWLSFVFRI